MVNRHVSASVVSEINLTRPGDFLFRVEKHFLPLREPAGRAWNREEDGEHGHRKAHGLIDEARVKVHVGIELALDEIFVLERDAFALQCDFEEWIFAHEIEDFVSDALDNAGAGIVILVNAMAEAHEFNFAGFDALDEVGDFADGTNFMEHADDFFVGAAMKRTVESGDGGGSGGIRIDVRAANAADDVSGTVLFVISVKDEENVERAFERRIRTITRFGGAKSMFRKLPG